MSNRLQKHLTKNNKNKVFINKTFADFRTDLIRYAKEFYEEDILDFSEASLGGLFLDFAAIVGDSLVYYAEQQFNEIDFETSTDPENIVKFLKRANIKAPKVYPSTVEVTFTSIIPADESQMLIEEYLPVIKSGTTLQSTDGIPFNLVEDVDFINDYKITENVDDDGDVITYTLTKKGICTSGSLITETFNVENSDSEFVSIEIDDFNLTKIISVIDQDNNEYFQVDYLTQDVVFKKVENAINKNYLSIQPAPYRYIVEEDYDRGTTILRFGNKKNLTILDNILTNPEDILLPMQYNDTLPRQEIMPGDIINTAQTGVSPAGKAITVFYKSGGGFEHNVSSNSITVIENPIVTFPRKTNNFDSEIQSGIISTLTCINEEKAVGGSDPMSLQEIKRMIPKSANLQSRVITQEDLLTRIMLMPSDFGKISKITSLDNRKHAGVKDIFIICKDEEGFYTEANDGLKNNLKRYITQYRTIGTKFNIVDMPVYNYGIKVKVKIKSTFEQLNVVLQLTNDIIDLCRLDSFDVGQPIDVNKITKIIEAHPGVMGIVTPKRNIVVSKTSNNSGFDFTIEQFLNYRTEYFDPVKHYKDGLIYPPHGSIFEFKYPAIDLEISTDYA